MKVPRYRVASITGYSGFTLASSHGALATVYWVADDWYNGREVTKPQHAGGPSRRRCERIAAELNERHRRHQAANGYDEAGEPLSPALVEVAG